jgi:phenylacetate-CoA ligase
MSADWKITVYHRLPVVLQESALWLYASYLNRLYYGRGFAAARDEFAALQHSAAAVAADWQDRRLRALVELAATRVPYYRARWAGLDWRAVRRAADLVILPRLDKQTLRQNESSFIAEGVAQKSLWREKTSGSTGTSLTIYWPKTMLPQWWALTEVAIRNPAGVGQDMPRAMFGGRSVVAGDTTEPPYWRYNRRWRQLYLSSYHIGPATAVDYVAALRRYHPQWLTGYGSAIGLLAECALDAGLTPVPMRAVIVSGDTLLPGMRRSIESFFDCKCFDSYGQCEAVSMAMECRAGRLHVIPAAGLWEILREDGSRCQPGEVGEIVATGLLNDVMPLFRYRLGDYAAWAEDQSCWCGNPHPIVKDLEGRLDDYLVGADGRQFGRLSTAMKQSPAIHSAQLAQDRPGHAYLLVRPGHGYSRRDAIAVRADILGRIGRFELEIVELAEIPKTPQGKCRLVIRLDERPALKQVYEDVIGRAAGGWERAA